MPPHPVYLSLEPFFILAKRGGWQGSFFKHLRMFSWNTELFPEATLRKHPSWRQVYIRIGKGWQEHQSKYRPRGTSLGICKTRGHLCPTMDRCDSAEQGLIERNQWTGRCTQAGHLSPHSVTTVHPPSISRMDHPWVEARLLSV